jgi:hypothetical protein
MDGRVALLAHLKSSYASDDPIRLVALALSPDASPSEVATAGEVIIRLLAERGPRSPPDVSPVGRPGGGPGASHRDASGGPLT